MPISAARSEAARQNGAHSHGPVTAEGKSRASANARTHGLLGGTHLLTGEDRACLEALLEAYLGEYQPATVTETRYVREMADAEWRLARVREHAALLQSRHMAAFAEMPSAEAAAAAFEQMADNSKALDLALRYEKQFQRQFDRARLALAEIRRARLLDQQELTRRAGEAFSSVLDAVMNAPTPGELAKQANLRNEPKPQPPVTQKYAPPPPPPTQKSGLFNLFRG